MTSILTSILKFNYHYISCKDIYVVKRLYMYAYLRCSKVKRRHWLAVTLSFTPCGDRQTDYYCILIYRTSEVI